MDILILTMSKWDGVYSSTILAMAKEMAKSHRVFYIDHPFTYKDVLANFRRLSRTHRSPALLRHRPVVIHPTGFPEGFNAVTLPPVIPINFLSEGSLYEKLSRRNDRMLNKALQWLLITYNVSDYVLLNSFNPFYLREVDLIPNPRVRIYQSRDHIEGEPYIARHGPRLEREQVRKADLVLTTSSILADKLKTSTKPVHFIENGVDLDMFQRNMSRVPPDLPAGAPIILYVGDMSPLRIDLDLLDFLTKKAPQYNWVFIGNKRFKDSRWDGQDHTYFLGPIPYEQLPGYMRQAACCMIPFALNDLTAHIYPLKINEYLATGAPVVSTRFSRDIAAFEGIVSVADNPELFLQGIRESILKDSESELNSRLKHAQSASWTARVNQFWSLVKPYC